jgi:hypothetical protein
VVSGSLQRWGFREAVSTTLEWGKKNNALKSGRIIPDDWERDFYLSVSKHPETHGSKTAII